LIDDETSEEPAELRELLAALLDEARKTNDLLRRLLEAVDG
jgi:hypothetical protein